MELNKFIGNKIKEFRESRDMTQDELAEYLKTTRQSVSRYEKGDRKANQDLLFQLSSLFKVKIDDFFPKIETVEKINSHIYKMYKGSVAAGLPSTIEAVYEKDLSNIEIPDTFMGKFAGSKDVLIMRTNGDSMNKVIPNGSLIGIKKCEVHNLRKNDIVVFSDKGEFSMKRFINDEANKRIIFRPDSSNDVFSDFIISYEEADELQILGKVILSIINYD